jgi:serine/threonine-protein kinase
VARPPSFQLKDPLVGKLFDDRYEVIEKIGEGGMGSVYKARQVAMDRMVALKVIHPDHRADEIVTKRFFREMKTTSRITHPNIVSVYDFGEADGELFLAMELLDGVALADVLDEGAMPLERALAVAGQILKALSAMHAEHIIHRDLKPENILLCEVYGEPDQVRVLDFGIATFASTSEEGPANRVTASGILVGTPSYVSPEQIGGEDMDARSDLYAFGVLLYEMVTGRLPFHDPQRPLRVLQMHMTEVPQRASAVADGDIPAWLDDLLLRLLAKYPDDRPASADEVVRLLEAPVEPAPEAAPERPVPTASSGLSLPVMLVAAVVLVVAGVVLGGLLL